MTVAYRFENPAAFLAAGGADQSEITRPDGIGLSVIGDRFDLIDDVEVYNGFLVNATEPVPGWDAYIVSPQVLMRVFG